MNILVDVVVPVHGQPELLDQCLAAVQEQNLIVVDDASSGTDFLAIKAICEKYLAKLYKQRENQGFPRTVNNGVSRGKAPLVLLLNSDCILESGAVDQLVRIMDDSTVGVVGALLTFPNPSKWGNPGKVQHAGLVFDITGKPFHIYLGWSPDNAKVQQTREVPAVTGACLMTRRSLWNSLGGMNVIYGKGTFEDVEFCREVYKRKLKVMMTHLARGVHYVGSSAGEGYPLRENYETFRKRNNPTWDEYRLW